MVMRRSLFALCDPLGALVVGVVAVCAVCVPCVLGVCAPKQVKILSGNSKMLLLTVHAYLGARYRVITVDERDTFHTHTHYLAGQKGGKRWLGWWARPQDISCRLL